MKNLDQYILQSLKGYKPSAIKPKQQLPENCSKHFYKKEVDVDEIDDIENLDTSEVIDMNSMFYKSVFSLDGFDLSSWDVSNVEDMSYMFDRCRHLEYLDLSGWDTSKVTNMRYMFYDYRNLIDIRFGSDQFNSDTITTSLDLGDCGKNKRYKLSDETYESMLTMYDRKKAGLDLIKIYVHWLHNIPDGWEEKMKERGYKIIVLGRLN